MHLLNIESNIVKSLLFYFLFKFMFNEYRKNPILVNQKFFEYYTFFTGLFEYMNEILYNGVIYYTDDTLLEDICKKEDITKIEIRYEDKYLSDIRKMKNEFEFTDEDNQLELLRINKNYTSMKTSYQNKINEYTKIVKEFESELLDMEDEVYYSEEDTIYIKYANDIKKNDLKEQIDSYTSKIQEQTLLLNDDDTIRKESIDQAKKYVIDKILDRLKNSYIIEKTPLGNVLMFYNNNRETFEYYSDNTIPYRYLETVGRKYVKCFDCRPLYVDMEEELKMYEEKLKKKAEEQIEENKEIKIRDDKPQTEQKKNVYAKFKSYNKEAGSGRVNTVPPPKNSIPNKSVVTDANSNEPVLLKERANRYTYEGKFANFNFLKKVDRKIVDKKYGMTFANFKKMQMENKN